VLRSEIDTFSQHGHAFAILSSGPQPSENWPFFSSAALDYAVDHIRNAMDLHQCFEQVRQAVTPPIIWHIHNPTLGCHPIFTASLQQLFDLNERLIFHIHDFAEDDRPENLRALGDTKHLYPFTERTHYIVLTSRDRDLLQNAGLPAAQISVIPNPVLPQPLKPAQRIRPRIVCPQRGIDRKNLGEMILLAAIAPWCEWATTLSPGQSLHQQHYSQWRKWAQQFDLPIEWEISENSDQQSDLTKIINDCTHIVSTAKQEGFGMSFLESIAWQRPMLGRAIPHIQYDLAQQGIFHPFLYERIFSVENPSRDFAHLSPAAQENMIKEAIEKPENIMVEQHGLITPAATWLSAALANRDAIPLEKLIDYSPTHHGEKLQQIDELLMTKNASAIRYLDANAIRAAFSRANANSSANDSE
jgi:hypothetical protein